MKCVEICTNLGLVSILEFNMELISEVLESMTWNSELFSRLNNSDVEALLAELLRLTSHGLDFLRFELGLLGLFLGSFTEVLRGFWLATGVSAWTLVKLLLFWVIFAENFQLRGLDGHPLKLAACSPLLKVHLAIVRA